MKKMIAVLFVSIIIFVLFYSRDFGWSDIDKNYVTESDGGLTISLVETNNFDCCYLELSKEEYGDFVDYFDVQIISEYYIDDMRVLNAYSKFFDKKLSLGDKKYNIQIAFDEKILVGYPQLYMGF